MNDLTQLLRVVLPVVATLLVLLAGITFLAAVGPALMPMGIVAAIVLAAWIWLRRQ